MTLAKPQQLQQKPDVGNLIFGKTFTDYMLTVEWDKLTGWNRPKIAPLQPLPIHPAAKVLHYAIEVCLQPTLSLFRKYYIKCMLKLDVHPLCFPVIRRDESLSRSGWEDTAV
jgi:hypothetical protein